MTTAISYDRALPETPGRTPYTWPDQYLEKLGAGDYAVRQGRRPSDMVWWAGGSYGWWRRDRSIRQRRQRSASVAPVCRHSNRGAGHVFADVR